MPQTRGDGHFVPISGRWSYKYSDMPIFRKPLFEALNISANKTFVHLNSANTFSTPSLRQDPSFHPILK